MHHDVIPEQVEEAKRELGPLKALMRLFSHELNHLIGEVLDGLGEFFPELDKGEAYKVLISVLSFHSGTVMQLANSFDKDLNPAILRQMIQEYINQGIKHGEEHAAKGFEHHDCDPVPRKEHFKMS